MRISLVLGDFFSSVCTNGMLRCHSWRERSLSKFFFFRSHNNNLAVAIYFKNVYVSFSVPACPPGQEFFNCSTAGTGELGVQCAQTCLNLDSSLCVSCFCCCVEIYFSFPNILYRMLHWTLLVPTIFTIIRCVFSFIIESI